VWFDGFQGFALSSDPRNMTKHSVLYAVVYGTCTSDADSLPAINHLSRDFEQFLPDLPNPDPFF
jgi:hypothetical protein